MRQIFLSLLLFLLIIFLLPESGFSQMRKSGKKVKKIECPIEDGKDYNFSLGIRVGDPYGITGKFYFPKRWAVELVVGRTFPGLHEQANEQVFEEQIVLPYDEYGYLGHDVTRLYTSQFRLVYHLDFQSYPGLDLYIAGGLQSRYYEIHYVFEYLNNSPPLSSVSSINEPYFELGPELAIGIEYVIPYRTMSSFAEIGSFNDLNNESPSLKFMGALGVRYNF